MPWIRSAEPIKSGHPHQWGCISALGSRQSATGNNNKLPSRVEYAVAENESILSVNFRIKIIKTEKASIHANISHIPMVICKLNPPLPTTKKTPARAIKDPTTVRKVKGSFKKIRASSAVNIGASDKISALVVASVVSNPVKKVT